jgi:hypothetical protein
MSEWMVAEGFVHFVSTDAHGPRTRRPLMARVRPLAGARRRTDRRGSRCRYPMRGPWRSVTAVRTIQLATFRLVGAEGIGVKQQRSPGSQNLRRAPVVLCFAGISPQRVRRWLGRHTTGRTVYLPGDVSAQEYEPLLRTASCSVLTAHSATSAASRFTSIYFPMNAPATLTSSSTIPAPYRRALFIKGRLAGVYAYKHDDLAVDYATSARTLLHASLPMVLARRRPRKMPKCPRPTGPSIIPTSTASAGTYRLGNDSTEQLEEHRRRRHGRVEYHSWSGSTSCSTDPTGHTTLVQYLDDIGRGAPAGRLSNDSVDADDTEHDPAFQAVAVNAANAVTSSLDLSGCSDRVDQRNLSWAAPRVDRDNRQPCPPRCTARAIMLR